MIARNVLRVLATGAGVLMAACAGGAQPGGVAPADLPALEAQRAAKPTDAALVTRLGVAYYDAKDFSKARDVLESAIALDHNFTATVYLGLTFEELGLLDSARTAYSAADARTTSARQKSQISDRLALLTRKELQQSAREAIARESELTASPPVENTVAVLPFRYVGTNEDLRPLERGLTHLVIADLGKVGRLHLLERERVQSLVDEMKLDDAGRVAPATGARSGRLLRAARVVQGSLQDLPSQTQLKLDVDVVNTSTADVLASGSGTDQLQQLFGVEKQVVLQLLQRMGITLSPAEQRAISERPTADLQAFLAFSRGLEAEDRGDFKAAETAFNEAATRDPNFRAASDHRAQDQKVSDAMAASPAQLAGLGSAFSNPGSLGGTRGLTLRNAISVVIPSVGQSINQQAGTSSQPPLSRPQLPEALRNDDPLAPVLIGNIIIVITRP
ncbi:MAG: CsgG/HfaB family protein [Gemmatimonadota bacterium]